jgi:hypothetical protein
MRLEIIRRSGPPWRDHVGVSLAPFAQVKTGNLLFELNHRHRGKFASEQGNVTGRFYLQPFSR